VGLFVFTNGAWAQNQVATVSSPAPFQLRGAAVTPGQGVPAWPVMPGDEIIAGDAPVTVTFPDGSSVILGVASKARIDMSGQTPEFDLESGSAQFSLKTLSSVILVHSGQTISPKNLTGDFVVNEGGGAVVQAVHPGLNRRKTLIFIGAAGAAGGLGYGIYEALNEGPSVSPSR
jgi:ferric-dicitrate binding protein FerR (iron transport regulator)